MLQQQQIMMVRPVLVGERATKAARDKEAATLVKGWESYAPHHLVGSSCASCTRHAHA